MEFITIFISIFSIGIAIFASVIAKKSLGEQKRIAQLSGNLGMLNKTHNLIVESPSLLSLHNIEKKDLDKSGISINEFVYILSSFNAAYYFYCIEDKRNLSENDLTSYRKNFLISEKVRISWMNFIKPKMSMEGKFVKIIDDFYSSNKILNLNE